MPRTTLQADSRLDSSNDSLNNSHSSRGDRPARDGHGSGSTVRRVPRQERSKLLVDCIRIAASQILEKDGPKAITTNNIAARAGVSIGSL
jgi:hypothetical protein